MSPQPYGPNHAVVERFILTLIRVSAGTWSSVVRDSVTREARAARAAACAAARVEGREGAMMHAARDVRSVLKAARSTTGISGPDDAAKIHVAWGADFNSIEAEWIASHVAQETARALVGLDLISASRRELFLAPFRATYVELPESIVPSLAVVAGSKVVNAPHSEELCKDVATQMLEEATRGKVESMETVGFLALLGGDANEAVAWYTKAADAGSDLARQRLAQIANRT